LTVLKYFVLVYVLKYMRQSGSSPCKDVSYILCIV